MKWDSVIGIDFLLAVLLSWIFLSRGSIVDVKKPAAEVVVKKCERPCYNGVCRNGTCFCSPGWAGPQCESCFGRIKLTKPRGYITEGPGNYSKNLRCSWLLDGRGTGARKVSLKLDSFLTECAWDNLFIYDGDGMYGKQLAALSGILSQNSDVSTTEFVAESGQAFVYFYSDLAYNMSGFNISYRFDGCPGDCNGHGVCEKSSGVCRCNHNWTGPACEYPSCLRSCNSLTGKCDQKTNECVCNQGWHGPNCDVSLGKSAWERILRESGGAGRASHAAVVVHDAIWVVGGFHFQGANFSATMRYDFSNSSWTKDFLTGNTSEDSVSVSSENRYDHSLVEYRGSLYLFGGIVNEKNVSSDLWSLELSSMTWKVETPGHFDHYSLPYHAAGHTAHVVGNRMVVLFGYNQYRGYMNTVQEYNFLNKTWSIPKTNGAVVRGTYGHSSVYDGRTESIFVYGGFFASGQTLGSVSDHFYKYHPVLQRWQILQSSGHPVFRHAAGLLNGIMLVVGGNGHNETVPSRQTKCFADQILAYDIDCGTWYTMDSPTYVSPNTARYGHVLVNHGGLYLYGGFDGRMLDDIVKFIPGQCNYFKDRESCLESLAGSKCVWLKGRCLSWSEAESTARVEKFNTSAAMSKACARTGVGRDAACVHLLDCATCTSGTGESCRWCDGKCSSDCSGAKSEVILKSEDCPRRSDSLSCHMFHTCVSCKTGENCHWNTRAKSSPQCVNENEEGSSNPLSLEEQKKDPAAAILEAASEPTNVCKTPCSFLDDCTECTTNNCMWCSTIGRCVDINSYLAAFPYGQCTQWTSTTQECINPTECSAQQTCTQCQEMGPRCGWCDDGSGTGLGECLPGGLEGPVEWDSVAKQYNKDSDLCLPGRWFFFDCPACQCNGHGHCQNISELETRLELKCESCSGMTNGPHCDTCVSGFYGNALNGGNCTECTCNEQATDCDPHSGECYCTTKGVSGKHCDKCDQKYIGDPKNRTGTCYYELSVDFVFTFRLDANDPKDKYVSKINFITKPAKRDTDVIFKLTCTRSPAKVNLSVYSGKFTDYPGMIRRFLANTPCNEIERRFSHDEFEFGTDANTTFFVFLYDFRTPVEIQISFAQTPPIDWIRFFITFACCFILLLVVAAALWKVKIRVDLYRRRQRMFVEMAQMASRPFGSVQLEWTGQTAGKKFSPSPISIEPCSNYRAAIVTVSVRLPTGGQKYSPAGQSGLAVASALCQLTPTQAALLQAPPSPTPEQKSKRRKPTSCFT